MNEWETSHKKCDWENKIFMGDASKRRNWLFLSHYVVRYHQISTHTLVTQLPAMPLLATWMNKSVNIWRVYIFSSPSLWEGSEEKKNNLKVNVVCIIFHSKRKKKEWKKINCPQRVKTNKIGNFLLSLETLGVQD